MIFFVSPRGVSMRHYQRDIYEWNVNSVGSKMAALDFDLVLKKQYAKNGTNLTEWKKLEKHLEHREEPEYNQETELDKIVTYKQSYFWKNDSIQDLVGSF
mmetsp:Transcript_11253/g.8268  ORF Transcript_11253/g.8268 Transcript_11253/m.8268 type:complete len:100 (+) Transcript_11253:129-428(+)